MALTVPETRPVPGETTKTAVFGRRGMTAMVDHYASGEVAVKVHGSECNEQAMLDPAETARLTLELLDALGQLNNLGRKRWFRDAFGELRALTAPRPEGGFPEELF